MTDRQLARTSALYVGTLLVTALLAGCSSDGASGTVDGAASVIAPGKPGEEARTLSPEEVRDTAESRRTAPGPADFAFMEMMIVHHRQALEMTALAERHADDQRVVRLAARIAAAQDPEIAVMEAWLEQHGEHDGHGDDGHGDDGHGQGPAAHEGMPGMATPEELQALGAARSTAFDTLFLELMITHHEGAVHMSAEVLAESGEQAVTELATEIAAQQNAETGRMRNLLRDL